MKERIVFRYMKHVPQIWGVQFPKILGIIAGTGLLIGIGQFTASTTTGKIIAFIAGAAAACVGYFACLMQEKQAELANKDEWPHVRETLTSQCGSEGFICISPKRQQNGKSRQNEKDGKNGKSGKNGKTVQTKKPPSKKERTNK